MLRQSKPATNSGTASSVFMDGADSAGQLIQGLLQFDDIFGNGPGQIPAGAVITSATLTLNVADGTSEPFSLYRMLTGWTEGSTWNSFGNGIQTDGTEAASTADVTLASLAGGTRSINVTQSVQAWADGGSNFGWAFLMSGGDGLEFTSSEGAIAPRLTVVYESSGPTPGLFVSQSGGSTSVTEGGQGDSISVALQTAPSEDVTVTVSFGNDIGVEPATLTFTPGNWDTAQSVSLSAVDDALDEGTETVSVTLSSSSSDSSYEGRTASVSVTVNDNDTPPPPPPPPGGIEVHDTMLRESRPTQNFASATTINVDGSDSSGLRNQGLLFFENLFGNGVGQIPVGAVINSATLTLNVTNGTSQPIAFHRMLRDWAGLPNQSWNGLGNGIQTDGVEAMASADVALASLGTGTRNINVTESVRAWASGTANFGWAILMNGASGCDFTSSEGAVVPRLTVDWSIPTAGLAVTESGGSTVVTEGGANDTIMVALRTAPTETVTVAIEGNADLGISPTSLIFTSGNWATPQPLIVSAVDDTQEETTETRTVTLTTSSIDATYDGRTATVGVRVNDNDSPPPPPPPELSVVRIHDTTQYTADDPSGAGCSDPSGIAYVPGLNLFFIADSEHDESPFFSDINLWAVRPDGTYVDAYSMRSFTREPTGLAYHDGLLYITDDGLDQVFWVDPANPEQKLGQINRGVLGIEGTEEPEFDPDTGHLYVLDRITTRMLELTANGALVRVVDLPTEITDAEGLAYDDARDVFYLSSSATGGTIFEMGKDGTLLDTFTLLNDSAYRHPEGGHSPRLQGLEIAPSSDPNDGDRRSLYAVDYGRDQVADGRLFELDLGPDVLLT
jgi:hypothetical protein